ncbi:DUF4091 domain-containing protein [Pedobacter xixiisoli]|uniref:Uncharacterized protein n=1 Tax=Pedobacter xixiisoli TaxID=1476464 RepID=A0A285ZPJ9_9SPHI|nr:DUF4091 domain-containing protein [Pedobacter xixiisoli]SOD11572.1 protein of unknown function [Pedobacter xixiisoli]
MKRYPKYFIAPFIFFLHIACKNADPKPIDSTEPGSEAKESLNGSFESKFNRYTRGEAFTGKELKTWTDTAWKNDRIHKQLILWTDKNIDDLSYEVENLKNGNNVISASNIKLRFGQYVIGDQVPTGCGEQTNRASVEIADALSLTPVNKINQYDPLKIWITIDVPEAIAEGKYTSKIHVKTGGTTQQTFNIDVLVVNRTLPKVADWKFHLDLWQFPFQLMKFNNAQPGNSRIEPFSDTYFKQLEPFYKLLADAGQKSITAYIKDGAFLKGETMIKWTKNTDNTWSYNYDNFDKYVETLMSWGINKQINCFSLAGWDMNYIGYFDAATGNSANLNVEIGSVAYKTIWNDFLNDFKTHLRAKAWFGKTVLYLDEIREENLAAVINTIKENDPNWKIGLAGSHVSSTNESALYEYSTILGTHSNTNFGADKTATFYTSCTQLIPNNYVTPQNNPAEMTWMAWYASNNELDGYLRWAYDYWTLSNPMNITDGGNTAGDFSLIYRSGNTYPNQPLSSIRLELLREGIQDFEKIRILNNSGAATSIIQHLKYFNSSSGANASKLVNTGQSLIKKTSAFP